MFLNTIDSRFIKLVIFLKVNSDNVSDALKVLQKQWVDFFDLSSYRETIAKDMSKGTRQKLMLSSAFIHEPSLMLLDEPFINLDPIYQRKVKDYLIEYVNNGGTVLLSTHILSLAEELCDIVAVINQGSILATDKTSNVVSEFGSLENAFLNRVGYYEM